MEKLVIQFVKMIILKLQKILRKLAKEKGVNLVIATDVVAADDFSNDANTKIVPANEIPDGWQGLDAGPESIAKMKEVIENSGTILWNGPVGVFEMENFAGGSKAIGEAIVEATKKGAFSLSWWWRFCSLCKPVWFC